MRWADDLPENVIDRVKGLRRQLGLTQVQMAEFVGVSFATVNRWENGQVRPTQLAWRRIVDLEATAKRDIPAAIPGVPAPDFAARPKAVSAVAEAIRLSYGHYANPAFATEISSIDPLPHQRIAVYEHMLRQSPLRFLLADDAGAGKTIMTGLYIREMLARRLVARILVIPPAGLVGNWEREMRTLFRLRFRIVRGADARNGNPFVGPDSDRLIVSLDTLCGEVMIARMREAVASGEARPYDLVVFDEAHKLAARREGDFRVRKTDRYLLAEVLAGLPTDDDRWRLGWSAQNLLLLTATPHMGKNFPYYCLWRLLQPNILSTFEAFERFPEAQRRRHFIRRTKEEMVRLDGRPLYPQRRCDTLSYALNPEEQLLYDKTTQYIAKTYNQAQGLNRSAARLAMSVFQRRLASSTHALMRSFQRRIDRLDDAIALVEEGRDDELERRQSLIAEELDPLETRTADEDAMEGEGGRERQESFEEVALGGLVATTSWEIRQERAAVEALLIKARQLTETGDDSKFEKLREIMEDPLFTGEKLIVFTEHRDTAVFLAGRLEGLGFTDQVALIHGGLGYREREAQVELFRCPSDEGGAAYLIATDAAGEGINLQFCWLMVNYDLPWNPARLEQRMGRIHRYGQAHDPVVVINLIAGETREGQVLKVLLNKLEAIRKQLSSDKVFDVVGRLFENASLKDFLEMAATDDGARQVVETLENCLTQERVTEITESERTIYGDNGDVRDRLPTIQASMEQERYRCLLPGYIRRFIASASTLVDLRLEGDPDSVFDLVPDRTGAADALRDAMESYPAVQQGRLTVHRSESGDAIWMHPGEAVFERFSANVLDRCNGDAKRGAVFVDPYAETPYLFFLAQISVIRRDVTTTETVKIHPIALRQQSDGTVTSTAPEHLLLLRGAPGIAPGGVPLAQRARELMTAVHERLEEETKQMVLVHQACIKDSLPERRRLTEHGFGHKTAELMAKRKRARAKAERGDSAAQTEFSRIKAKQRLLVAEKQRNLEALNREPTLIEPGSCEILVHALVVPTDDPAERQRHDAEVETIAMQVARAHEEAAGATVRDVSTPPLARLDGLGDWPGFDLRSRRPADSQGLVEDRAIEVKGRATSGSIEVSENEWSAACNLRNRYWLYVVFDCATPRPRLVKVRDPFGSLLVRSKGSVLVSASDIMSVGISGE